MELLMVMGEFEYSLFDIPHSGDYTSYKGMVCLRNGEDYYTTFGSKMFLRDYFHTKPISPEQFVNYLAAEVEDDLDGDMELVWENVAMHLGKLIKKI